MGLKRLLGIGKSPGPTELLVRAAVLLIVKRMQDMEIRLGASLLKQMKEMEGRVMGTLDDVIAKVTEQSSVVASAAALIDGLQDKLTEALKTGVDPEKIKTIVDTLEADKAKLVEAMKENTIAVVETPTEPVVEAPVEAPVEEPVAVEEPEPEPAPEPEAAPAEQKFDEWGNPIS